MNIHTLINWIVPKFRVKRMKLFVDELDPSSTTLILDIGGTFLNWDFIAVKPKITILNLSLPNDDIVDKYDHKFIIGDATKLEFADNSFDVAYSNSVIEHLYTWETQIKFANEAMRVGKKLYIQTPAKSFFVEPHYITPFIHFLPKEVQKIAAEFFYIGSHY
jgi:SAM-dependent methyltransferase